jgi:hypothetical protein
MCGATFPNRRAQTHAPTPRPSRCRMLGRVGGRFLGGLGSQRCPRERRGSGRVVGAERDRIDGWTRGARQIRRNRQPRRTAWWASPLAAGLLRHRRVHTKTNRLRGGAPNSGLASRMAAGAAVGQPSATEPRSAQRTQSPSVPEALDGNTPRTRTRPPKRCHRFGSPSESRTRRSGSPGRGRSPGFAKPVSPCPDADGRRRRREFPDRNMGSRSTTGQPHAPRRAALRLRARSPPRLQPTGGSSRRPPRMSGWVRVLI